MITTKSLSAKDLRELPESVLKLVSMGQYSLYSVEAEDPQIAYVLRTGPQELFFLRSDGAIAPDTSTSFRILSKVDLSDVSLPFVVSNFWAAS